MKTRSARNQLARTAASGNAAGCSSTFSLSWNYDAWGNRTDQNVTGGTCNAFHASVNTQNQLVGPPYQYDAAGNMTNDGNHTYFYYAENRLVQVDGTLGTCSTATACYLYDALGYRTTKSIGAAQTNYIYGLDGSVISEVDQNNTWMNVYLRLNGQFFAQYTIGLPRTEFVHVDHLGSPRLLTLWGASTRIQSSGGTNTWKYYISGVCPSVSGTTYTISVWVKNQGATSVKISGNIVDSPTIAPGTTQQVSFNEVGNGTSCAQLGIATVNVGDSFDILAFAPAITPSGSGNLIASGNQNFSGWTAYMGASVTVTQGQAALTYDSMDYLPFGEQIAGGSVTTHKFTGDERDSETSLDHTWFRQYSSQFGRWMHPDPASLAAVDAANPQSWNRYSYVDNDPLNFVDPSGLNRCYATDGSEITAPSEQDCKNQGGTWIGDVNTTVTVDGGSAPTYPTSGIFPIIRFGGGGRRGGSSSWAWTFTKAFVNGVLHGDKQRGQTFGACMDQNIKDATFGTVDPKALTNKALITAESTMFLLGTIPARTLVNPSTGQVATLNGIQVAAISLTSWMGAGSVVGAGARGTLQGGGYALAVAGAATFGLVVGSAINCR